ncbi:uncharacterized protein BDZ99DRAFT_515112 [Mytilinidion resinicola]|uniref:Uncharacterized protein n=1 Tax=Mytilinidion resinicola TaxID=574789 RepID=A0A6A6Z8C3_9PEZI|nr:uncharacterized protein BDZ99DRAFT_515112 [Mytilinidion resinicola]KAF2816525.1 hypothetical protein BDZ99DRAFT_515112 [Mytilinidion resinicola]
MDGPSERRVSGRHKKAEPKAPIVPVFDQIAKDNKMLASEACDWYFVKILETATWCDFLEAVSEGYTETVQGRHPLSVRNFEATWKHAVGQICDKATKKGGFLAVYKEDSRGRIFRILRWTFEDLEHNDSFLYAWFRRPGSPNEFSTIQNVKTKRQSRTSSPTEQSPVPRRHRYDTPSSDPAANLTISTTPLTTPSRPSESPLFYTETNPRFCEISTQFRAPEADMGYRAPSWETPINAKAALMATSEGYCASPVVQTSEYSGDNIELQERIRQLEHDNA